MTPPIVSVCIPTHNRPRLLEDAVASVLSQSMPDFELLIIDDGSSAETAEVIDRLLKSDQRIRTFRNEIAAGPAAAKNLALREARGVYWAGLDDDDLFLPQRLEQLVKAAREDLSFVCTPFYIERNKRRHRAHNGSRKITPDDLCYYNLIGNQAFVKISSLRQLGGFDETMRTFEDYDLWLRVANANGAGLRLAEPSYVVRQGYSPSSLTFSDEFCAGARRFADKHGALFSAQHWRAQKLIQAIACNQPITIRLALASLTRGNFRLVLRLLLARNLTIRRAYEQLLTRAVS